MPDELPSADGEIVERARQRGRRVAHGLVILIALAFIAASAIQIIPAVFGRNAAGLGTWRANSPTDHACAVGLRVLAGALDRGSDGVGWWGEPDETRSAIGRDPVPSAGSMAERVSQACAGSREGLDAWAALERLRSAREQVARRGQAELGPLRRDLLAHLPTDLR
ncbi:MAG: hypothetical protein ABSF69_09290 [Polyangiaceae bacterium]|jgi:hypothetical protein